MKVNNEPKNPKDLETIVLFCGSQKLRWAGHMQKMTDVKTPNVMTKWVLQWKLPRGRPKQRRLDCVEQDWCRTGAGPEQDGKMGRLEVSGEGSHASWRRTFLEEVRSHQSNVVMIMMIKTTILIQPINKVLPVTCLLRRNQPWLGFRLITSGTPGASQPVGSVSLNSDSAAVAQFTGTQ